MAKKQDPRREELRSDLATKRVYHFVNDDSGVDVKSREEYKNKSEIRHFPFNRDGSPKYKSVKFFKFVGFKNNSKLPVGINKSPIFGLGFTKYLAPLIDVILQNYEITEIHILKDGVFSLNSDKLVLTESVLKKLQPKFKHINDVQRQDRLDLAAQQLSELFPKKFKVEKKPYVKNSIYAALESWSQDIKDFSEEDKESIKDLFDKLVLSGGFLSTDKLLATKNSLEKNI